jgi:hypothetical protein
LPGPDFCFIFAPGGYDEPEILPPQNPSICLTRADGKQSSNADELGQKVEAYVRQRRLESDLTQL